MQKEVVLEGGHRLVLDTTGQVFSLDSSEETMGQRPLSPYLKDVLYECKVVPLSVLGMKAKQFDDGLYAAIELLAQDGAGKFTGKVKFLNKLQEVLRGHHASAFDLVCAAGALGGWLPAGRLSEDAKKIAREFESSTAAKPIAFYTWSDRLRAIFAQDRFLQQKLDPPDADALLAAVGSQQPLIDAYCQYLQLMAKMTNRLSGQSLAPRLLQSGEYDPSKPQSFFPASASKENDLLNKSDLDRPGFNLMDDLIEAIKLGKIDLKPKSDSGWYEYCQYALEPLLVPERTPEWQALKVTDGYRKFAELVFKAYYALTKETHAKQFPPGAYGSAMFPSNIFVRPQLRVEPLPSVYLRRAEAYRFIKDVLIDLFGKDVLQQAKRLTVDGPVAVPLLTELAQIEQLFFGAYLVACADLDMKRFDAHDLKEQACIDRFFEFARQIRDDVDLSRNAVMMLPVYKDIRTGHTKVWVFLGWRQRFVTFSWAQQPRIISQEINDSWKLPFANYQGVLPDSLRVQFGGTGFPAALPVMHEIFVKDILNRTEMQNLCASCGYYEDVILNKLDVNRQDPQQQPPPGSEDMALYLARRNFLGEED